MLSLSTALAPTLWNATTMKFLMLVTCLLAVKADGITDDIYIDGVPHQAEVLYNISRTPWWWYLAVDYKYNYLYIVAVDTAPVILNLNTNEHIPYLGKVKYVKSLAVDQETHDLYIGARSGLYKYKPSSGEEELVGAAGYSIGHVHFNGVLYYTELWIDHVRTLINGHSDYPNMPYKVHRLVIDNEDVMFFSNITGFYSRQMDSGHTTLYYNGSYVNNLALDINGRVYFAIDDGIYEILKHNASYRKVVSIEGANNIAFDKNNNIIYCHKNVVYRLKPTAEVNITNNCSDRHEQNVDVTNNTNTMNIIEQLETKLDIMDKKMDKLVRGHVEMQKSMSQKIYKLETDLVKILDSNTNIYKLITGIVERNQELENMDRTTARTSDWTSAV